MKQIDVQGDLIQVLEQYFDGLHSGGGRSRIRGGQSAADVALANLDISGYAGARSQVLPRENRGATVLSPYIRHNLLTLPQVWNSVEGAPSRDREKYRDELLWQEYARHVYARLGARLFSNLRYTLDQPRIETDGDEELQCIQTVQAELEEDGWLVNQTRMWLASHWAVRQGLPWLEGQENMYRELIDGSRAANLLGWQWTAGSATGKPYGFARWQVEKRAPGLCATCAFADECPIEEFPEPRDLVEDAREPLLDCDPDLEQTTGPMAPMRHRTPDVVLLTVDSLGDADPALIANPDLPVVFVFHAEALRKLQLSAKRILFTLETLQDLAQRRDLQVFLGNPATFVADNRVAVTHAPVPSFRALTDVAEVHPFPWLIPPHPHTIRSFSAWRQRI